MSFEEHFAIRTADGVTDLRGQIDFPDATSTRLPLLTIVSGGGPQDRDGYFGDSGTEDDLVYRQISRAAVGSDFAVLRWDYRGVRCNEMTMPPAEGTSTDLERAKRYCEACLDLALLKGVTRKTIRQDVEQICLWGARHPRIDPGRIVILAHSEGVGNVSRLILAGAIRPRGVLLVCGGTGSPAGGLRWQVIDRYVEKVLSWSSANDGLVSLEDIRNGYSADAFFSSARVSLESLTPPAGHWDAQTLEQHFTAEYERWKAVVLATDDSAPYPDPGPDDEFEFFWASYDWLKQFFTDEQPWIDLLRDYDGKIIYHFGEIDSQLPSLRELEYAKSRIAGFQSEPVFRLHPGRGHILRTGHPSMGPMDAEAISQLVHDAYITAR